MDVEARTFKQKASEHEKVIEKQKQAFEARISELKTELTKKKDSDSPAGLLDRLTRSKEDAEVLLQHEPFGYLKLRDYQLKQYMLSKKHSKEAKMIVYWRWQPERVKQEPSSV